MGADHPTLGQSYLNRAVLLEEAETLQRTAVAKLETLAGPLAAQTKLFGAENLSVALTRYELGAANRRHSGYTMGADRKPHSSSG